MRVYMIYSTVDKVFGTGDEGINELYAFTNNKKLFKLFKSQRNMKLFVVKKYEMTTDEYKDMGNTYREAVLQLSTYRSKKKDPYPDNEYCSFGDCVEEYTLVTTYLESQIMNEELDSFYFNCNDMDLPNPLLFNKSIRKILTRYGLDFMYKLKIFPDLTYGEDYYPDEDQDFENFQNPKMKFEDTVLLKDKNADMEPPDAWVDQLEVFIKKFGRLLDI